MNIDPGNAQPFPETLPPPPPPPAKSRRGLWIGLGIGVVVLCLVSIIGVLLFTFRQNIPLIANFFPSPTPTGLVYTNSTAGFSVTYPVGWVYSEEGDATSGYTTIFASSADVLSSGDITKSGALIEVITGKMSEFQFPSTVDVTNATEVQTYLASQLGITLASGETIHQLSLQTLPAASGVYAVTDSTSGLPMSIYLVTAIRGTDLVVFFGGSPQGQWTQYQPVLDGIINSITFLPVP